MNNTIVVGVTDSSAGRRALDWAAKRAADRRQKLLLIGVVGGAIGAVGESDVVSAAEEQARTLLESEAARVGAGLEVSVRVDHGNPVAILTEASRDAALLVLGSDYRGPEGGPARGVHGIRIAAGAHSPVVVVPDLAETDERRGVIVGVDGSPVSEAAIRFAAAEADRLGEPLIAISVWTPLEAPRNVAYYPELYLSGLERATEETLALSLAGLRQDYPDLEIVARAQRGYPSAVLNEAARGARMTVLGTHGRGALARFLLGSISQEVLYRLAAVTAIVR